MVIRSTALTQFCRYSVLGLIVNVFLATAMQAADAADLTVSEFSGAVKLKVDDRWQDPRVGMVVGLPASVSTGADGSIKLVQDGTVYSVAANTALEFSAGSEAGQLVRRVVQEKGSAFYDVGKRERQKLRVETPYLVAVIKGTQFNVTVEPESAAIALFEGLLLVEAPDIGETVDLRAGFIARRHKDDTNITVIPMDNGEPVAESKAVSGSTTGTDGSRGNPGPDVSDDGGGTGVIDGGFVGDVADGLPSDAGLPALPDADGGLSADLDLDEADLNVGIIGDVTSGTDQLSLEATSDLGAGDLGVGLDAGLDADLGSGELGVDLGADVDVGDDIGVGLDAGVDVDLGSGELGVDLGADVDVGDIGADLDAGVDADLGSGELGVDLGADVEVGGIDAGLDAGIDVDLGSGDLGVGASVGDTGLDVGLDDGGLVVDADLGGLDETLDDTVDLVDDLLGGDETDTEDTTEEEEEESVPLLPDLGDLLGL
jgi:hypothetical protein